MLGAGVPVHVVASIHGHDPVITQRIYAHTQTADAVAAMSALDKILRPLVDAWAFLRPHRGRCGLAGSAGTGRSRSQGRRAGIRSVRKARGRRVGATELAHGLIHPLRLLKVAHVTSALEHDEFCVRDRFVELARDAER